MIYQEHYGKKFYQDKKTGYWISTCCPKIRSHRWVWINCKGDIPKGCHIHHKDEDKSNNNIENLELMAQSAHMRLHMTPEKREQASIRADKIRPLTKEWHASPEGLAWHKYHALKSNFGKWEPKKYNCDVCNAEYETSKRSNTRFCSNACKSKLRRDAGLDDVVKTCPSCNNEFTSNKYAKNTYCGRSCAQTSRNRLDNTTKT